MGTSVLQSDDADEVIFEGSGLIDCCLMVDTFLMYWSKLWLTRKEALQHTSAPRMGKKVHAVLKTEQVLVYIPKTMTGRK
jgi:hypothetical protein